MVSTVLITGSTTAVPAMAEAVTTAGATPVIASTQSELDAALADVAKGELQYWVQLPTAVTHQGDTVTARVHSFLEMGLLSRYRTAETVLPYLSSKARVVLVAGNTNSESSAPDDRSARLSLVHVLKHAMRADTAQTVEIQVASPNTEPAAVAATLLKGTALKEHLGDRDGAVDPGLAYDDWRVEVLGSMQSEF